MSLVRLKHGWSGDGWAFDQSLTNTGFVYFSYGTEGIRGLRIHEMGVIQTLPVRKGWADNLARCASIYEQVCALLGPELHADQVLCEMPPIGKGMYRPDASIVAAAAVYCAAAMWEIPCDVVSANTVKRYLTGNGSAEKKEVRKALEDKFADQLDNKRFRKNEHVFDALGIAVTWCENMIRS